MQRGAWIIEFRSILVVLQMPWWQEEASDAVLRQIGRWDVTLQWKRCCSWWSLLVSVVVLLLLLLLLYLLLLYLRLSLLVDILCGYLKLTRRRESLVVVQLLCLTALLRIVCWKCSLLLLKLLLRQCILVGWKGRLRERIRTDNNRLMNLILWEWMLLNVRDVSSVGSNVTDIDLWVRRVSWGWSSIKTLMIRHIALRWQIEGAT